MGSSIEAGESYVVGEREPELFVPNADGMILNKKQARKNINLLEKVGQVKFDPRLASPTVARNIAATTPPPDPVINCVKLAIGSKNFWKNAEPEKRKVAYQVLVESVILDKGNITVKLLS